MYVFIINAIFHSLVIFCTLCPFYVGPVLQPTPTEVKLTRFLPLDQPEDSEVTPILTPDYDEPDAATAYTNGQPIIGQ